MTIYDRLLSSLRTEDNRNEMAYQWQIEPK